MSHDPKNLKLKRWALMLGVSLCMASAPLSLYASSEEEEEKEEVLVGMHYVPKNDDSKALQENGDLYGTCDKRLTAVRGMFAYTPTEETKKQNYINLEQVMAPYIVRGYPAAKGNVYTFDARFNLLNKVMSVKDGDIKSLAYKGFEMEIAPSLKSGFVITHAQIPSQTKKELKKVTEKQKMILLKHFPKAGSILNNLTIKEVDLFNLGLTDQDIEILFPLLSGHKSIHYMRLGKNKIGDKGVKVIAKNDVIDYLSLSYNSEIGDEGARVLAQNTTLTRLDLIGTKVGNEGAKALAKGGKSLVVLHLQKVQLTDEGAMAFLNKPIKWLYLGGNRIRKETEATLRKSTTIENLNFGL